MKSQRDRELLRDILRSKDLWMMRALALSKRLESIGLDATDTLECKDKKQLYCEIMGGKERMT